MLMREPLIQCDANSARYVARNIFIGICNWPQSRHWDWRRKVAALQGMLANPGFSIICDGLTQGMMIVDTVRRQCRVESQKGQHLVYVGFVENAPWNRAELLGADSTVIAPRIPLSLHHRDSGFAVAPIPVWPCRRFWFCRVGDSGFWRASAGWRLRAIRVLPRLCLLSSCRKIMLRRIARR